MEPKRETAKAEESTELECLTRDGEKTEDRDESHMDIDELTRCGLGGCNPGWMQTLANKKVFIMIFGFLGMMQTVVAAYYVGSISTVEKRFRLPSSYTGIISSSGDFGAIFSIMFIAYFGGSKHKTKWVAWFSSLAAGACFLRFLPHLIYGSGSDSTPWVTLNNTQNRSHCVGATWIEDEDCNLSSEGLVSFTIMVIAQLSIGVGCSAHYTLGAAYLDDNVVKSKFPFLFAISECFHYVGPTIGYVLASYTLSFYHDPEVVPPFDDNDPRWIGAWYRGWIPLGIIQFALALALAFFPRVLPREALRRIAANSEVIPKMKKSSFKDFRTKMTRLLKNKVFMYNSLSATFYIFGCMGYWLFMPKYIETQFRKSASVTNIISGVIGLIFPAIGILIAGAVVSKFKPRARYLALWNVITEVGDVIAHICFAFLTCHRDDMQGIFDVDGSWNATLGCNLECNCISTAPYDPVCSSDGTKSFYSPCYAGCTGTGVINDKTIYTNCSCLGGETAVKGMCPAECGNDFAYFLVLLAIISFLGATGRSGNTIIQYRSVSSEDKSLSIAFIEVLLCIATFVPAPIFFGVLLDKSCLIWDFDCGESGNCWLYSAQQQRYFLNFSSAAFLFIGMLLDIGVVRHVGSLDLYEEEDSKYEKKSDTNHTSAGENLKNDLTVNQTNHCSS